MQVFPRSQAAIMRQILPVSFMAILVSISACKEEAPFVGTSLTDTVWNVIEIEGVTATLGMEARYLDLVLAGNGPRIGGFAGCNRFSGSYEIIEEHMVFGDVALTFRSCPRGMEQEKRFFAAIQNTRRFKHEGDNLTLFDSDGKVILTFEAVHFRI